MTRKRWIRLLGHGFVLLVLLGAAGTGAYAEEPRGSASASARPAAPDSHPAPKSISSDRFALAVCHLGTTRKITAGGKVVYTCWPRGAEEAALAGDYGRPNLRRGILAECREGSEHPLACRWQCLGVGVADCGDFLEACTAFGGTAEGDAENATCSEPGSAR